jgi:chromosome segregation ATPase
VWLAQKWLAQKRKTPRKKPLARSLMQIFGVHRTQPPSLVIKKRWQPWIRRFAEAARMRWVLCALLSLSACQAVSTPQKQSGLSPESLLEVSSRHASDAPVDLKRELDLLIGEQTALAAKLDDTRLRNRQLHFEVDALSRTRNAVRASLKTLDAQEESLTQDAASLAAQSRDFLERLTIRTNERRSALARLNSLRESKNATNAKIAELTASISSLAQRLGVAEGQLRTATKALADREADLAQLVDAAESQATSLSKDVAALEATKQDLTKQVAELQAAANKLSAERVALLSSVDSLQSAVSAAQQDLKLRTAVADAAEEALGESLI